MCLAQDKYMWVVFVVLNVRFKTMAGNFLSFYGLVRFSRRTLLYGVSQSARQSVGQSISSE
jgi:hypothetical protein